MTIINKIIKRLKHVFFRLMALIIRCFGIRFVSNLISVLNKKAFKSIQVEDKKIQFYTPNSLALWRADTLLTKEPDTIEWINSFAPNDVFWDIGANVGCYSLYAGHIRNIQTHAFEPSPSNYPLLIKNIEVNKASEIISAYGVALSNKTQIAHLNMTTTEAATAHSTFGENRNQFGEEFKAVYKHTMFGFSIDDLISKFDIPFPTQMKVDVDGIEDLIISGAPKTLSNKKLKSVLIELNIEPNDYDRKVIKLLNQAGLVVQQTRECGSGIANYIFVRDEK